MAPASAPVEHERKAALYDLVDENHFALVEDAEGPYELRLGIVETRLVFDVGSKTGEPVAKFELPLAPLSKIMRNYFVVYDTFLAPQETGEEIALLNQARPDCSATRWPEFIWFLDNNILHRQLSDLVNWHIHPGVPGAIARQIARSHQSLETVASISILPWRGYCQQPESGDHRGAVHR